MTLAETGWTPRLLVYICMYKTTVVSTPLAPSINLASNDHKKRLENSLTNNVTVEIVMWLNVTKKKHNNAPFLKIKKIILLNHKTPNFFKLMHSSVLVLQPYLVWYDCSLRWLMLKGYFRIFYLSQIFYLPRPISIDGVHFQLDPSSTEFHLPN